MNHNHHNHGKKHGLLMLLCCLIPLILLVILPWLGINLGTFTRFTPFALFLLCPLIHVAMMIFMVRGQKGCHSDNGVK